MMKLKELKSEFHELIDQVNDPELLLQFYDAISQSVKPENSLWQSLSIERQLEVLAAFEESENEENLISLSEIKSKYKEWPLK
ncbi:MAG TPA: hypothetical protein VGC01_01700 [Mucilaginibacter sp.]